MTVEQRDDNKKSWIRAEVLIPMIPATVLAIVAIFWLFQGIATQDDLILIRNDIKSVKDDLNQRLDKLDRNFEYIRNNMVTKSDIQQIQDRYSPKQAKSC